MTVAVLSSCFRHHPIPMLSIQSFFYVLNAGFLTVFHGIKKPADAANGLRFAQFARPVPGGGSITGEFVHTESRTKIIHIRTYSSTYTFYLSDSNFNSPAGPPSLGNPPKKSTFIR